MTSASQAEPHPVSFVWSDDEGLGRMVHVYFRRELRLAGPPTSARLNLFADTNYHLRVNGEFVGFGPARSYPEFPEYDSYDIAPMLGAGDNVIAVHVLHVGTASYHNLVVRGGLAAWGSVVVGDGDAEGGTIDLSTERDWLCMESAGHDPAAARFSFAIPPLQIFDERAEPPGWDLPGRSGPPDVRTTRPVRPEGEWKMPVPLKHQDGRGELRPRSIPHLTHEEVSAHSLLSAHAHETDEEILSFRVSQDFDRALYKPPKATAFACTYVHSPRAQEVRAGTWWGENYLNGQPLRQLPQRPEQFARTDAVLDLREGWNFLFMTYGMVLGIWEMHLAVPKAAGLAFSPEKDLDSDTAFLVAGPFLEDEANAIISDCPPDSPGSIPALAAAWRKEPRNTVPVSPAKGLAWCRFGEDLALLISSVRDIVVPAGRDASFVFDMGREVLGRVIVEFEAPEGTVVDGGYEEKLRNGRPDYFRNVHVSSAERQIARGGPSRMETFFPRGFRYLHVAVTGHDEPVTIRRLGAVWQVYPYEKIGSFECSDPFLNTLWDYGRHTLRLCSEDVITDCPWRERTLYGGDLLPETATALVTSGDWRLPRRCIEVFLQSQSEETGWLQSMAPMQRDRASLYDYPLLVLLNADWYCRWTGDVEFARRAEPVFRRMMKEMLATRDGDGVFVNETAAFIDWIKITKSGRLPAVNALAARALEAWASILGLLGKDEEAGEATRLSRDTARVTRERFWDGERGAFADSIQEGKLEDSHFIASSAWPMMFGLTAPEQDERIVEHFRKVFTDFDGRNDHRFTTSYGAFYMLGALYEKGCAGLAEESMRRLYRDMVLHPTGTVWEHFHAGSSLAHAWSSAPTYYLSTRALGVRLGFPDSSSFQEVVIAPESDTLEWARGVVPHPRGPVSVDWAVRGERLVLDYEAPEGVEVKVAPGGRLRELQLWVNGNRE